MESKKRSPISEEDKTAKKLKIDSASESPTLKTKDIEVIPPKSVDVDSISPFLVTEQKLANSEPSKGEFSAVETVSAVIPPLANGLPSKANNSEILVNESEKALIEDSNSKKPETKVDSKEDGAQIDETKERENLTYAGMDRILKKMQFQKNPKEVLELIKVAKKRSQGNIVVTDSRLMGLDHPNRFKYLGHIVYTGARSRAANSNRAVDLELFLCPEFNESHHFATIQVRIPAEFLSYRGNIAVRKSALWGTDIYSDDSDVVAMIIHSGHYRPVDAPDPAEKNPDSMSVDQAALVKEDKNLDKQASTERILSEIDTDIVPVIARSDPFSSSSTILVPDHDLHVTLRILPKLQKYTGSTRYGLDSKGWGSHDGESVKVEKVEKVQRGSVRKSMRKVISKAFLDNSKAAQDSPSLVFCDDGSIRYKYTPQLMNDWPQYLKHALQSSQYRRNLNFSEEELINMKDMPFWHLQLTKYHCVLENENKNKYILKMNHDGRIEFSNEIQLNSIFVNPEEIEWDEIGLIIKVIDEKKLDELSNYAEKHGIFDMLSDAVTKLVINKPADPLQFLINHFGKPQGRFIVVLSPPASGIHPFIENLARQLDLSYIHVSNLLEKAYNKQSSAGVQAKPYKDRGQLVPDSIVIGIVLAELNELTNERGCILDGFPKTKAQAVALVHAGYIPDHVLDFQVPSEVIAPNGTVAERNNPNQPKSLKNQEKYARTKPFDSRTANAQRLGLYNRQYASIVKLYQDSIRHFYLKTGLEGTDQFYLKNQIMTFLGTKKESKAPRGFRIIIAGYPGSGKTTVAENLGHTFGLVVVSVKEVMLQCISAGNGAKYIDYMEKPYTVPSELIREDLRDRLLKQDCRDRGWVLDGFPTKAKDAEFILESGIQPNRVMWLNCPQGVCHDRLANRRYDPESSRVINLSAIPHDLEDVDLSTWIRAPEDQDLVIQEKFKEFETTERDLKRIFGVKQDINGVGIMHSVETDGVGELDISGNCESIERTFERVQSYLLRPVPAME